MADDGMVAHLAGFLGIELRGLFEETLVDGDLSVLGQPPGRYHYYSRGVRLEYPQADDQMFAAGRMRALDGLLSKKQLFGSFAGRGFWEAQARGNLDVEHLRWSKLVGSTQAGNQGNH